MIIFLNFISQTNNSIPSNKPILIEENTLYNIIIDNEPNLGNKHSNLNFYSTDLI